MAQRTWRSEEWLRQKYEVEMLSTTDIAKIAGCSPQTVTNALRRCNVQVRPRSFEGRRAAVFRDKPCQVCREIFSPSGPSNVFCSSKCQYGVAECDWCGEEFVKKSDTSYVNRFCSKAHWYEFRRSVGKYRYVSSEGYVVIETAPTMHKDITDKGYVRVNTGRTRVLEHRLVMEEILGRKLHSWETVHHIDGNRQNNEPLNLELHQGRHGRGMAFVCRTCGSHDVVPVGLGRSKRRTVKIRKRRPSTITES